jgi:hypothetical protein
MQLSYSQKEIPTTFIVKNDTVTNVKYYRIQGETKLPLSMNGSNIILDEKTIKQDEVKLLAVFNKKRIEFFIKPQEMYYLTIKKDRGIFNRKYIINQGFDYEEIVKCTNKSYN